MRDNPIINAMIASIMAPNPAKTVTVSWAKLAEAYSKGIAYRIYKDLLNVYDDQSLVIW